MRELALKRLNLLTLLTEHLGLILEMAWVQPDEQLRRLTQGIRRYQLCQGFNVRVVWSEVDETAGVRDQLTIWFEAVQAEIRFLWKLPLLAEVPIIGRDAADVDPFRIPIGAADKLLLLKL
jgi:hypothetical protein